MPRRLLIASAILTGLILAQLGVSIVALALIAIVLDIPAVKEHQKK